MFGEPKCSIRSVDDIPGFVAGFGERKLLIVPSVTMRPILSPPFSVNQSASSGPATIHTGLLSVVGIGNSVIVLPVEMRPILFPCASVNQSSPSGPGVTEKGRLVFGGDLVFRDGLRGDTRRHAHEERCERCQ